METTSSKMLTNSGLTFLVYRLLSRSYRLILMSLFLTHTKRCPFGAWLYKIGLSSGTGRCGIKTTTNNTTTTTTTTSSSSRSRSSSSRGGDGGGGCYGSSVNRWNLIEKCAGLLSPNARQQSKGGRYTSSQF